MNILRHSIKHWRLRAVLSVILAMAVIATTAVDIVPQQVTAADQIRELPAPTIDKDTTVAARVQPDKEANITSVSRKVSLHVPKDAVPEEVEIRMVEHGRWGPRAGGMFNVVELNAYKINFPRPYGRGIILFQTSFALCLFDPVQQYTL